MDTRSALEQLLATLTEEESHIAELLQLGLRERDALVSSDYEALNAVTALMLDAADRMDQCEVRREALLVDLERHGAGLTAITELAVQLGMDDFSQKGKDLRASVDALRDVQEQNAQLILSATRLRERWLSMLTRMSSPSYGPDSDTTGYRFLSRTA